MPSPNLAITHVAAAQNQKEVTLNDAVDALDLAMTDTLALDFSAGPVTLTLAQFRRAVAFRPDGLLSGPATLAVPQARRVFVVINSDGFYALQVVRGTTTITLPPGTGASLCTDGTANGLYAAGGGGDGGGADSFVGLNDTPDSYTGQQGRAVMVNAGATALVFADLPGLGALSGRSYFSGATGSFSSGSTTAYATKGLFFVPTENLSIIAVLGFVSAAAAGQPHYAQISRVSTPDAAAQVLEVLATSQTVDTTATDMRCLRLPFASPVTLVAGTPTLISLTNAAGSGTTALRLMAQSSGTSSAWWLNAPGDTFFGAAQYDTLGLSPGQTPAVTSTGIYCLALEGHLIDHLPVYPVAQFAAGQPSGGQVLLRHVFTRAVRLAAGSGASRAVAGAEATAPAAFNLRRNGAGIGEVQFAAGSATGNFSVTSAEDFLAGDVLSVVAPASPDATLADISVSLVFGLT